MNIAMKTQVRKAAQWYAHGDHECVFRYPPRTIVIPKDCGWLYTEEGDGYIVAPGDWILEDEDGRMFVSKPEEFEIKFKPQKQQENEWEQETELRGNTE